MTYDQTLRLELIKIATDKFAIGLIVLFAGFLLNRAIERYKASQALHNELSKQRFAATLQRIERQLSEFYWPLYLRLQKDNTVWRRLLDQNRKDGDPLKQIGARIEADFILPNHSEMVKIIETRIHLAELDPELQAEILSYIDHVAVYNAAIAAGFKDLHNTQRDLLTPWPHQLFPLIEARTRSLQSQYESVLQELRQA
jgi:hypothetical protein